MKVHVYFENKLIMIILNSPLKIRDFIFQLAKKINFHDFTNEKIVLMKNDTELCLDEEDFIIISKEIYEVIMIANKIFKPKKEDNINLRLEEDIMFCTESTQILQTNKLYNKNRLLKANPLTKHFNHFRNQNPFTRHLETEASNNNNDYDSIFNQSQLYKLSSINENMNRLAHCTEVIKSFQTRFNQVHSEIDKTSNNNKKLSNLFDDDDLLLDSRDSSELYPNEVYDNKEKTDDNTNTNTNKDKEIENKYFNFKSDYTRFLTKQPTNRSVIERIIPKFEVDDKKLEDLMQMGFEEERCRKALAAARNNIEYATELLLLGTDFDTLDRERELRREKEKERQLERDKLLEKALEYEREKKLERERGVYSDRERERISESIFGNRRCPETFKILNRLEVPEARINSRLNPFHSLINSRSNLNNSRNSTIQNQFIRDNQNTNSNTNTNLNTDIFNPFMRIQQPTYTTISNIGN